MVAPSFTSNLRLSKPVPGDPSVKGVWGTLLNTDDDLVDQAVSGLLSLNLPLQAGFPTVILSSSDGAVDQARNQHFVLTGVLTQNATVLLPASFSRFFSVSNQTTGAFTVTIGANNGSGAAAGTTVTVPQGATALLMSDGTNVAYRFTAAGSLQLGTPLGLASGGTGGATVAAAAAGLQLAAPPLGSARNLTVTRLSATTLQMTADEVVVETALGGTPYRLSGLTLALNIGTTGAGGMDTGVAPTSGDLSVYLVYNPATLTAALLAVRGATSNGSIYSGANMPAGYTAAALVSSLKTNGAAQFGAFQQIDRKVFVPLVAALAAGAQTAFTAFSIAAVVPANARTASGNGSTSGSTVGLTIASDSSGSGGYVIGSNAGAATDGTFADLPCAGQQLFYKVSSGSGNASINGYTF